MRPLSYSSVRTYLECPLRWKLKYVEGLKSRAGPRAALGATIHSALEAVERAGERSRGALLARFEEAFTPEAFPTERAAEAAKARGREALLEYHREALPERPEPLAVEQRFRMDVGGVPFQGVVDRLEHGDRGVVVVDYKTTRHQLGPWAPRKSRQLGFYQMGVEEGLGYRVEQLAIEHVPAGVRYGAPPRTGRELDQLRTLVHDVALGVEAAEFPARLNPGCPCEFANRCPYFSDLYPKVEDWTGEVREEVAAVVDAYAASRDAGLAERLHAHCEEYGVGRVWGREHVVTRVRAARTEWDRDAAARVLGRLDCDTLSDEELDLLTRGDRLRPQTRARLKRCRREEKAWWQLRVQRRDA